MTSWVGQFCIYVGDIERSIAFYEALGLECTSRTELDGVHEAIVERPGKGGKLQLAEQVANAGRPIEMGHAVWKLYIGSNDIQELFAAALAAGATVESEPERLERWPMSIGFVRDPDGYLVELTQRHPWTDGDDTTRSWLNQFCFYVTDIERTIAFYETLGLECTSRTEIPGHAEAILEQPGQGGKLQLAQQLDPDGAGTDAAIDMGTSMWKLYVNTDSCQATYDKAIAAGHTSVLEPLTPERWPVTLAFVGDPDGYQVELVERHPD